MEHHCFISFCPPSCYKGTFAVFNLPASTFCLPSSSVLRIIQKSAVRRQSQKMPSANCYAVTTPAARIYRNPPTTSQVVLVLLLPADTDLIEFWDFKLSYFAIPFVFLLILTSRFCGFLSHHHGIHRSVIFLVPGF